MAEDLARDHDLVLTSSRPWGDVTEWPGEATPAQVRTLQWDAADPELVSRMMADLEALDRAGVTLSGAILVAGTFPEAPLGSWSRETLDATWGINLTFPLLCAQALAPRLAPGACLQFLLDTSIHTPWLRRLPYSVAKGGLATAIPGLARLLAPRVRVVGHALGTILPAEDSDAAFLAEQTLLQRLGTPADLCRAVRFAADSPFLTGEILTLDGGRRWR